MSALVVITFDHAGEANELRRDIRALEQEGAVAIEDSAVIMKDEHGKVHVVDETDKTVVKGAAVGGIIGLLLSFIFPVAGIALGAIAGGLVGASMDMGVDKKFVKEVRDELKPNSSALFLIINEANINATLAAMRQHTGKVYQTNLPAELEDSLRDALHDTSTTTV